MDVPTQLLLIDDHRALTDALKALLKNEHCNVKAVAHTYSEGLNIINKHKADVVIVDMNLGKEDSCDLIKLAKKRNIKPIVLSAYTDVALIKRATKSGALAYLSKSSTAEYITTAINEVTNGNTFYDPIVQSLINQTFAGHKIKENPTKEKYSLSMLTKREKEIIKLIAAEYTSEEIAKELFLSKNTIDSYRKNLIMKVGVRNSVGLGVWAAENRV
ncbi:MAG: response regulator transcription factor [Saprospiraceae bacterium]